MTHLKMNRFYYDPLPEYLELRKSDIHGHGIFATKQLRKNFDLGSSHIKIPMVFGYIRTPLGGFVNHAENNNCVLCLEEEWDDYLIFNIYTIKKILKGEEIVLNYEQ